MIKLVLLIAGYVNVLVSASTPAATMDEFRLSGDVLPEKYNLEIVVDLNEKSFGFYGNVTIKIICVNPTKYITLHSSDLIISESEVYVKSEVPEDNNSIYIKEQVHIPGLHFYRIHLEKSLIANKAYNIFIPFKGNLTSGLVGLYRSSYFDSSSNTTKWMASTHFEPIYARKAFPCFDEPAMKAKFKIKLGHEERFKSLSNMPKTKSYPMEKRNGWVWTEFAETELISTYLIAYVVGDIVTPKNKNTTFKVWGRPDVLDQIAFAQEFGPKVLEYYEKYFKIKYPLPKLDMIAIPDFSIGAMENWGLITYRESALLYNEKGSDIDDKHGISSTIAHEIAHQWFGNLVTMKWWTDLWLKEGFASFLGNVGVENIYPQWNFLEEAVLRNVKNVYYLDSLNSSHPVSVEIKNPNEIAQIFDVISYQKGAMIIRMMNSFLGKSFQLGLSDYLVEHKYGNAEQDDLWAALTNRAHKDKTLNSEMSVKKVMDSWTLQTGYPLITVERDFENGTVSVRQERYYLRRPTEEEEDKIKPLWWVPLTYTTLSEKKFNDLSTRHWLHIEQDTIITEVKPDEWIIFNIEVAGLYRVQYDTKNWEMIINTLNSDDFTIIPKMTRSNLLLDAFDLAYKGELNYELVLKMAKYLNRESEYVPLTVGLEQLQRIGRLLVRTPSYGRFQAYIRSLISPIYARYNDLLNPGNDTRLHALITQWACLFDIKECRDQAINLFEKWRNTPSPDENNPIPTDIRATVYSTAIRHGDSNTWDFLWQRYINSHYATEKRTILEALGCSRDVWILNRYLEWSLLDNSEIRRQDSATVYVSIVTQPFGAYVATDFLRRKINEIQKYHSQKSEVISTYLAFCAKHYIYQSEIKQWEEFIKNHLDLLRGSSLAAKQSIDVAYAQGEWINLHYEKIAQLLSS